MREEPEPESKPKSLALSWTSDPGFPNRAPQGLAVTVGRAKAA